MERFRNLEGYRKFIIFVAAAMTLLFTVLYIVNTGRRGFAYRDALLFPKETSEGTVYAGKLNEKEAAFTVSGSTVEYRYGDKAYGPYVVKEDPTAVPKEYERSANARGIEVYRGEKLLFRGCSWRSEEGDPVLIREDGSVLFSMTVEANDGVTVSQDGKTIDTAEPSLNVIVSLTEGPALLHRGNWTGWAVGVFSCVLAALSALFWDKLFRWNVRLQLRNAENAEPSDWMIASRVIGWILLLGLALFSFFRGLGEFV